MEETRERGRKNRAIRRATDPLYRLVQLTRSSVRDALRSYKVKKNFRTFETLGYNVQELYEHLEAQFEKQSLPEREPITWDNQGAVWAVDHIKPIASFKLINDDGTINKEQFKECWALKNLQPLYNDLNSTKSSWYDGQYHRMGKAIKETNTYKPQNHFQVCPQCGKEFVTAVWNQTFCTTECKKEFNRLKKLEQLHKTKTCAICGEEFTPRTRMQLTCSDECRKKLKTQRNKKYNDSKPRKHFEPIPCNTCGKLFVPKKCTQKYCSTECLHTAYSKHPSA